MRTVLLLSAAVVVCSAADDSTFISAMKNLLFGDDAKNATASQADMPRAFHQYARTQSVASGSSCLLPQQIGTGPYRIPRWYYNPARSRCELFYWSGCCGNGNNFQTFQTCQANCEASLPSTSLVFQPAPSARASSCACCLQPVQSGEGPHFLPQYHFDQREGQCRMFIWRGGQPAIGGNRFSSETECESACGAFIRESPNPCAVQVSGPLQRCQAGSNSCGNGQYCHVGANAQTTVCCPKPAPSDKCQQPLNIGIGNANVQRWYFNPLTQQCQACVYKGLQGNENNFLSRQDCENSCLVNPCARGTPFKSSGVTVQCSAHNAGVCPTGYYCHVGADSQTSVCCQALGGEPCSQPRDNGQGRSQLQRWYWNQNAQCCQPFNYCGLKGTQNNFLSQSDCERTCFAFDNPCALGDPLMSPSDPRRPQLCSANQPATCGTSHWCHFGANQDTTLCCPGRVEGLAICQQPKQDGFGEASLSRWYYDAASRRCAPFMYKGKFGNQNNFLSQAACEQQCPAYVNVCPSGEPQLDPETNRPVPCTFGAGSCGADHFCHLGLVPDEYQCCPGSPTEPAACEGMPQQQGDLGAAAPASSRWYYDASDRSCKQFLFNGRKGNQNNFITREDCEATCPVFQNPCSLPISMPATMCSAAANSCGNGQYCHIGATAETSVCCPLEGDRCSLPQSRGSGSAILDRWYYNQQAGACQPFTYTGMQGNANNFQTREDCEEQCGPNPCAEGRPFVGVDGRTQTCSSSANLNTCPANHWCHVGADMPTTVCCPGASTNVCNLPMSTGEGTYNLERYYFDSTTRACRPFIYNGLKGNQNNFISLRSCQLACQPLDNPCIGQPATTAAGQVLFCSATNKDACPVNFWCHIGATPETTVCCPGATNPCSVPLAPGTGNNGLSRWYYNPDDRECVPFQYNGKRGNQNNFETQSECERTCPEELCLLSIDRGACGGRQTRYAFNRQTSQCVPFEYTGCGGNLNNFVSMADCMSTCGNVGFR